SGVTGQTAIPFYASYMMLLAELAPDNMMDRASGLMEKGAESSDLFQKYGLIKGVVDIIRENGINQDQIPLLKKEARKVVDSVGNPNYQRFFQSMLDSVH